MIGASPNNNAATPVIDHSVQAEVAKRYTEQSAGGGKHQILGQ